MITPLLCGTDKAAVVDRSVASPLQRASSETVGPRSRPSSSGRGGRSRSVDDMLETNGGESPFSKAKKLVTPSKMRSFAELFRSDRLSSTSPPTAKRGGGGGNGGKAVTFGVPLSELCSQSPGGIPNLVAKVTQFVEDCCLDMEGVYRLSPNARIIEALKAEFDKTGDADLKDVDPASVSCLLKLFLRELPEPLIPVEVLQQVVAKGDTDYPPPSSYLEFLHEVVSELPAPNYALLKYLIRHLHIVSRHHAKNKMNPANLAIVFGPNFFSFGGSLDFLQNQTSSMPALRTMIEYYKDIFCDQPLGQGRVGPAVPKPYKQHRQDAIVYEDVTFPHSAVDRTATSDSGIYEVVQPAPPSLSRGRGLHSSSSSNDEVFENVAPDDHHVMQNGVMYAVVNKKRKPTSTDGKGDTTIPTDGKRDTPTSTDGKRDTPTSTDGKRDTPTSTDGKRDTPTSTNGAVCNSRPSGYDGYEEIDVDLAMAKKKGGHLVASSVDVSPQREQVEEVELPRSSSPLPLNSSPSPYNSPCLTPRRAKALDEAISETVQDLLFNPLQTGQPLKDDSWITVSAARETDLSATSQTDISTARQTDVSAARQTDVSAARQTDVSAARQTDVSAARQTDVSTARQTDVSTARQTDVSAARQTDVSAARQMRRHKKSSREGVENRSQSLDGDASPVARRQLVISDHKLRNRSSGAFFAASLNVLEHQEDSPDGGCEGDTPEQTVGQHLKMFEHKPVMGLLPDTGTQAADATLEESVEQTDGNSFVFEGVTLSRAAPLHHLTKTRVKGPRSRRPSGDGKTASANSERRVAEIARQSASPPVAVEPAKPESELAVDNHAVVTVEQRGVVTEEQRGVVTEEQRGVAHRKLSGGLNAGVVNGAMVFLMEVTQQIQSTLREKRKKCDRPEELHEMSWEQLLDEKKSVQTAILQFEKQHGRPQTKSGKDIMKPVYHRYRDIKKRISDGRVAHEVARISSPTPEHSTLEATLPNVTLSHSLPPQLWREGGTKVASEMVAQRGLATPTGWGPNPASTPSVSTAAHGQSLNVLEDQKVQWEVEKNTLRKKLRAFEKAFEAKHGRMPVKADRPGPIDCQYSEYKRVKGRLRSTSVEAVTAAQLHQTV